MLGALEAHDTVVRKEENILERGNNNTGKAWNLERVWPGLKRSLMRPGFLVKRIMRRVVHISRAKYDRSLCQGVRNLS